MKPDPAKLKSEGSVVTRTAGAFKVQGPPWTAEELREAAEVAIAEQAAERSGIPFQPALERSPRCNATVPRPSLR